MNPGRCGPVDEQYVGEQILHFFHLMSGDQYGPRLVHVVIDQCVVEGAAGQYVEAESRLVEHQQSGVDGHGQGQVHPGLHALGQFAHAASAGDTGFGQQCRRPVAAKARMDAGDEIDGVVDAQPRRQHRDIGDETRIVHERRAFVKGLAAQHLKPTLVGGQSKNGAQSAGLAGAVGPDEPDYTARLHREIGPIQRNVLAVFFRQILSFDERRHDDSHSSLGSPPRGGGAGWVSAGVCANNS